MPRNPKRPLPRAPNRSEQSLTASEQLVDVPFADGFAEGVAGDFDCRTCGACCSYSAEWPRFTLESDSAIARIPPTLINRAGTGITCTGDRCAGLTGTVGGAVSCAIYNLRPDVCRECMPGDDACRMARARFGLTNAENGVISA